MPLIHGEPIQYQADGNYFSEADMPAHSKDTSKYQYVLMESLKNYQRTRTGKKLFKLKQSEYKQDYQHR